MKEGIKVAFILDHKLMHYRHSFMSRLSALGYAIVVYHTGEAGNFSGFNVKNLKSKRIGVFEYRQGFKPNDYDVVIVMQNLKLLNLYKLAFDPFKKFKMIQWGIGVSSANGLHQQSSFVNHVRQKIMRFSNSLVFYSAFPLQYLNKNNLKKAFVALNTIYNPISIDFSNSQKDGFLFIGSLNKRKGVEELILSFRNYLNQEADLSINKLFIIGEGEERDNLIDLVEENKLENNVILLGKMNDFKEKSAYFERCIASISLKQAGLAVLESFSFGVPFIANFDAISGGEHLNIIDNYNGFLTKNSSELTDRLMWLNNNPALAKELGKNAYNYYVNEASMDKMVDSFSKAIQYAFKNTY